MALVPSDVVLAQQNVEYATDIKRRVAKGANKSQKILEKHLQTINHAISNSKQNVVKALLQARSLEKAKTQTLDIHNNLHRQLLEKLHPNIFQIREDVEDAVTFNFKKPLPGELLSTLDAAMHWNYPKLIQELVAALTQYSDADFRNYLSTIPDRFLPMSELLFQQIAELGSKGAVSPHEAFVLFAQTKAAQISDSRLEWKQLQNRLCRKILQLFLVKCAAPIVLDVEEKLRAHRGFQFVVSKGSPSSPRPLSTETNSLLLVSASPSPSPFATSSLLPETPLHHHQQQQQQQRKNDKTSTTTRKQQRHSESAKANQSKSKKESTAQLLSRTTSGGGLLSTLTSSSAPLVDGNMSASQLAEELQRSQAKQEALKQRMLENMASFVLQHPSEYVHGRKRAQNEATLRAAQSIQQTFRVFIAKKAAVIMRNNVRRRRAVRRLESMWIRYKHILARKKQRQHQLQERSVRLIQRVYRGHRYGRKQRHQLLLRRRQYQGALRMQGLVRMYHAKERVDRLRRDRLCGLRIVVLQGLVRMAITRRRYQVLLRRHHAVLVITYAWWCSQARYRVWCTRRYQAARRIQCLVRCRIARKRYGVLAQQRAVWRAKRAAAIAVMRPLWLGYLTRRRLRPTLQPYLARRQQAAIPIQCLVRCFLARHRVHRQRQVRAYQRYRIACATKIQALVRAKIIAFHRVQRQRDYLATAYAESRKRFLQLPYYYRLKSTYLTSQDVYHRRYVLKIQCCARRYLARKRIVRQKRKRSALIIQSFVSNRLAIAEARAIVAERRKSIAVQRLHVICLQRMTRGLLQRRALKRAWASQVLRWATREVVVRKKIAQAMATYRARKAYALMYGRTVVRVQAWVRARLGQRRYKQQYRTLVRQRAMRIRARREKAALRIQWLHGEWMQELLVIRAQTGFRGHKARETFRQKVEEYKRFHAQEQANVQQKAAAKIQALLRGVLARKQFKKNLPALKRARRALAMCIECETKPATRRCRSCRDKYCADCFELIHAKGHRKEHSWENVTVDTRILAMTFDAKSGGGGIGGGGGGKKGKKGGAMPAVGIRTSVPHRRRG
eukprot:gene2853-2078_t